MPSAAPVVAAADSPRLYTALYYRVFAAVFLFMTGAALFFHFGQYVAYREFGPDVLGWILSLSMVGSLAIRLHIGKWIDRFGCRPTFFGGAVVVAASVVLLQFTASAFSIGLLRTISTMATAAVSTTVSVFAAQIAPPLRRAESIGTMGLAGFLGMMAGPTLGDWIFALEQEGAGAYRLYFLTMAAFSLVSAWVMLRTPVAHQRATASGDIRLGADVTADRPASSQVAVVIRHWPGAILAVNVDFCMAFCLQACFLERLAEDRGFHDIKLFFLVYSPAAIAMRLVFRRAPQVLGRTRTVILGLSLMAAGLWAMIGVQAAWQLVLPGLLIGAGHSFVFPSMVDLAAERLPAAYRGTGTAVILGAGDVGMLVGFATLGEIIDTHGFDAALKTLAACVAGVTLFFAICRRRAVLRPRPQIPSPRR